MKFSPARAKAIREELGLSRPAASRACGLSRQGLINIEDGVSVPSVATLARMATAYRRESNDFFVHEPEADTPANGRGKDPAPTDAGERLTVGA